MLEQLEAIAVTAQFNAFELLDRDADAKTLHGVDFAPGTRPFLSGLHLPQK